MTVTRGIGAVCGKIIDQIVRALALSRIHPNVLTFLGLVINIVAGFLLAAGRFQAAALVVIGAGLFDMVDGRVARETNRVTRFGGFFDSVLDRYFYLAGDQAARKRPAGHGTQPAPADVDYSRVILNLPESRAPCLIQRCG